MRRTIVALGAACLALALAGCGGGTDEAAQIEKAGVEQTAATATAQSRAVAGNDGAGRNDPTPTPTPTPTPEVEREPYDFSQPVPESEGVDGDYFADACFIGDSRTEGLRLYSGITQGDFIVHTGLKVFDVDNREITYNGESMKVLDALGLKQYGKVYVCLGLNELGMFNDQGYYNEYAELVDNIRAIQPDAIIYIQLLIPVNTQKCAEKGQPYYVTNQQIGVYNGLLRQLAQDKQVPMVDPAEVIVDESGELPYETSGDGVHFNRSGYTAWYNYLTTHTVEKEDLG